MNIERRFKSVCGVILALAIFTLLGVTADAQQATIEGMIIGRNGPEMSVRTNDTPRVTVILSDTTKATEKGGFLGMGRKDLGIAALVPGLAVKVEGSYDPDHKLIAKKVEFSRGSLKTARQIDAGLNPVNEQMAATQDQLRTHQKNIEQTQADIARHSQDIAAAQQGIAANSQANNENKQAIGQANQRFGQLDEYDTKGSVTVNFANGQSAVTRRYKNELIEFLKQNTSTPGYMVEVQGYASKDGSAALNQRLSAQRADNVLTIIQQSGLVPLTRILAPAAMGTTSQVGSTHSRTGRAQNRRVVVTILTNKGITADSSTMTGSTGTTGSTTDANGTSTGTTTPGSTEGTTPGTTTGTPAGSTSGTPAGTPPSM